LRSCLLLPCLPHLKRSLSIPCTKQKQSYIQIDQWFSTWGTRTNGIRDYAKTSYGVCKMGKKEKKILFRDKLNNQGQG
jgi:hypothetical protein